MLTIVGVAIHSQILIWAAAPIKCPDVYVPVCTGTTGDDVMIGGSNNNIIGGNDGNDNIYGHGGDVIIRWPGQPPTIGIEKHKIEGEYFFPA